MLYNSASLPIFVFDTDTDTVTDTVTDIDTDTVNDTVITKFKIIDHCTVWLNINVNTNTCLKKVYSDAYCCVSLLFLMWFWRRFDNINKIESFVLFFIVTKLLWSLSNILSFI